VNGARAVVAGCVWLATVLPSFAADRVSSGEFVVEPATLIAAGFEWYVEGDDNRNASVSVSFRRRGDVSWREALALFRLQREKVVTPAFTYVSPNMFAGSVFDLEPGTEYEFRLTLSDPNGVSGQATRNVVLRTRPEPQAATGGRILHVYPRGYEGPVQEPAFRGLKEAYFSGSIGGDWFNAYPPRVQPGDVILVHAGIYKDDRYRYGHELVSGFKECCDTTWDGTYYLTVKGTPEKPIVIRAAGDGDVVFDGDGNHVLFNVMAGDYTFFEGLTFRNTAIAIQAGQKKIAGARGIVVKRSRFEAVGVAIHTDYEGSRDFYIADNVMLGRHDPSVLTGFATRGIWQQVPPEKALALSQYAVKVYGPGHVIAFNRVRDFHDGIDHATYGLPDGYPKPVRDRMPVSIDIYNNDISNVHDDCVEADGAMHNIRVLRNRCVNAGAVGFSMQPVLGGPAYFIRNVHYHAPAGGAVKFSMNPAGALFYHNTFVTGIRGGAVSNVHFRNNIVVAESPDEAALALNTFTGYSSSDYNAFLAGGRAKAAFSWRAPQAVPAEYDAERPIRSFSTLADFSRETGQDAHSVPVEYDVFQSLRPADPAAPTRVYDPASVDVRLKPDAAVIDRGVALPNVNDGFSGRGPDLGALEVGQPTPHYGPRP
jgi:hypothetical protein